MAKPNSFTWAKSLLVVALWASVQVPASAVERTTIVVWGLSLGADTKGDEAVIHEFERVHPEIRVRLLSMGAGRMNPQKLMTAIVGKVPPDMINQDRFTISDWASRGAFRPLDDLIARDEKTDPLCPRKEQYYPAAWEEATFMGRLYGIPTGTDDRSLFYNKTIFRQRAADLKAAGLDPKRPPRTWSELLAYSKVLTEFNKDGSLKRAGFLPNYGNSWLYMYAFLNNASFMSADGRTCTFYSPASEEALKFMVQGYDLVGGYEEAKKFETGFQGSENDPFMIGKVAMKIDGDWIIYSLSRFAPQLDFANGPPPIPDDRYFHRGKFAHDPEQFVTWIGGFSYCIPKGAHHVEEAWKFIKFATSTEGRLLNMRAQRDFDRKRGRVFITRVQGSIETNRRMYNEFKPPDAKFAAVLKQCIDLMDHARIRPTTFVGQLLWDEHVRAMENACLKKMSPKAALLAAQEKVQRELDEEFQKERFSTIDLRIPSAVGLIGAILGGILLYAGYKKKNLGKLSRHEARWSYLFLAPWVIGFFVFTLGPMLASLFFSFTQYNVLSPARWVGPKNYVDLVTYDKENVLKAFSNVLYIAGIGVPLGLITSLAVAMLLNSAVRGMRFYRTLFYMPAIVPSVASVVLWMWILTPDPGKGLLNSIWQSTLSQWLGAPVPGWLQVESWAKPSLILMGLWGAGSGMILWLAGLKGVPTTLYEAASIDGASPNQQFWSVTLPQLSPIVFFNTVMGFIGSLQTFDSIYVVTQGLGAGPSDSLLMPVYHLFTNGFNYFKMGYASALAWVIFIIILALTLFQFKLAPRWVHYEAEK